MAEAQTDAAGAAGPGAAVSRTERWIVALWVLHLALVAAGAAYLLLGGPLPAVAP